jgi:hypothetical protein
MPAENQMIDFARDLGEIHGKLDMILGQTTKTNGHVADLYEKHRQLESKHASCPVNVMKDDLDKIIEQTEVTRFYSKYVKHFRVLVIGFAVLVAIEVLSIYQKMKLLTEAQKSEQMDYINKGGNTYSPRPGYSK